MSTRGQAAVEFMQILAFFLIITLIYSTVLMVQFVNFSTESRRADLQNFADSIANQINKVALGGHGFKTSFYLRDKYYDESYNVSVNSTERTLEINLEDNTFAFSTIFADVEIIQWNFGSYQTFENVNGVVIIK